MPLEYALQLRGLFPELSPWKSPHVNKATVVHSLGIESLPLRRLQKSKRKPFRLNMMVAGEAGLGKSTFINTLFNADIADIDSRHTSCTPEEITSVSVTPTHVELVEDEVTVMLSLIDTQGFGCRLDRSEDLKPILDYIDNQYAIYHDAERSAQSRRTIPDTRVHVCLYFIAPIGHCLRELDLVALCQLSNKTVLIPIIAKADTLTTKEMVAFKAQLRQDLKHHGIKTYPTDYPDKDRELMDGIEECIPFSVMGSNEYTVIGGQRIRARKYKWGYVPVENPEYSDVVLFRKLLMDHSLHELCDIMHTYHYNPYRARVLCEAYPNKYRPDSLLPSDKGYSEQIAQLKCALEKEMLRKEEKLRLEFVKQVRKTENTLKKREEKLHEIHVQLNMDLELKQQELRAQEQQLSDMLVRYKKAN